MARLDLERKRKTAWPLVAGVAVLALIIWGVTALLTEEPDAEPEMTVPTVEDTRSPAAVPAPPDADPELTGTEAARAVEEIAPLGEEDVGQTVRVAGEVVATGNEAFWLLAGKDVVRVDSGRHVRKGDTVSIEGTLRPADPATTDLIASDVLSRHPASSEWNVVRAIKVVEEEGRTGLQPAVPRPEA
ncbi:MAG TPA: hypothetical protein VMM12_04310 [Longimicrobiales bacterium]|nr:hypothetical protein [Longimicrobiales bacterium]